MKIRDRAKAVGLDPDDPRYQERSKIDGKLCHWCLLHDTARPRLRCDTQQAEFALMEQPASKCFRCHEPFNANEPLCPACRTKDADGVKAERRRKRTVIKGIYVDDSHGCVERATFAERAFYPRWFRS